MITRIYNEKKYRGQVFTDSLSNIPKPPKPPITKGPPKPLPKPKPRPKPIKK